MQDETSLAHTVDNVRDCEPEQLGNWAACCRLVSHKYLSTCLWVFVDRVKVIVQAAALAIADAERGDELAAFCIVVFACSDAGR